MHSPIRIEQPKFKRGDTKQGSKKGRRTQLLEEEVASDDLYVDRPHARERTMCVIIFFLSIFVH